MHPILHPLLTLLLLYDLAHTANIEKIDDCAQLLIYHRIQKSGSTCIAEALTTALKKSCGSWRTTQYISFELRKKSGQLYDTDVAADAAKYFRPSLLMLHGHFYYGIHRALPLPAPTKIMYIVSTVEPLQRAISHFNFRRRIGLLRRQLDTEDVSWQLFLDSPAVLMCNEMVAAFSGANRLTQSCDHYTHTDYDLLQQAKYNVEHHYNFIFLRSYMKESWQMMHLLLPTFPHQPACGWDNSSRKPKELPTAEQFDRLKKAFLLDRLLYKHIEKLFFAQAERLHFPLQKKPAPPLSNYYVH